MTSNSSILVDNLNGYLFIDSFILNTAMDQQLFTLYRGVIHFISKWLVAQSLLWSFFFNDDSSLGLTIGQLIHFSPFSLSFIKYVKDKKEKRRPILRL
jgi:hypothetical protein